ncbi:DUF1963 domain-containing protein [Streptomyces sp. enrichment culture]|uniref:DUF1963 domain-containing protein n=1 Tax=Streptomyces sp. enrichment culture TaxID=1795815 RepID=UPI003F56EFF1
MRPQVPQVPQIPQAPRILDKLGRFRDTAHARGVPSAAVEKWLAAARPCATLSTRVDGPVVGRLGGPALLPADAPELPPRTYLIASLDLAALPEDATAMPLPRDGRLLLFARSYEDGLDAGGEAVYVPAGTPVEERRLDSGHAPDDPWSGLEAALGAGKELRLRHDVSLPDNEVLFDRAERPHAWDLRAARADAVHEDWLLFGSDHLQLDGYTWDPYGEADVLTGSAAVAARRAGEPPPAPAGPWEEPRPEHFALLAQWYGGPYIDGQVYWTASGADLAARRFDRATVLGVFEGPG